MVADLRVVAKLRGAAQRLIDPVRQLTALGQDCPIELAIECNNIQESLDLLRYKLQEHAIRRVVQPDPRPPTPKTPPARRKKAA